MLQFYTFSKNDNNIPKQYTFPNILECSNSGSICEGWVDEFHGSIVPENNVLKIGARATMFNQKTAKEIELEQLRHKLDYIYEKMKFLPIRMQYFANRFDILRKMLDQKTESVESVFKEVAGVVVRLFNNR